MDMQGAVEYVIEQGYLAEIVSNPMFQFGQAPQTFLGPQFLPDRMVEAIEYTEEDVRTRAVIANDGTRHNPVQKKQTVIVGARSVRLGHSDIGSDLTASDYDAIVRLFARAADAGRAPDMGAAAARIVGLAEALRLGLEMKKEKQRWEMLLHGQVVRRGNDKYQETVTYPVPSGNLITVGGTWSNNSYDPYSDIMPAVETLRAAGWDVNRIVTSTTVTKILALNAKMTARVGRLGITSGAIVNNPAGRVTSPELSALFGRDGLPPAEVYDRQYRTQTGTGYYFDRDCMFLACTTGRNAEIDRGDGEPLIVEDVLGYTAVGPPSGQSAPGPVVKLFPRERKPQTIEGEAFQATLPVAEEPEAWVVLNSIA